MKTGGLIRVTDRGLSPLLLLPLALVAAYWLDQQFLLVGISFVLPLLLVLRGRNLFRTPGEVKTGPFPPADTDSFAATALDPLTGLYNRQYILQQLEGFLRDQSSTGAETAILHIDIDDFHQLNNRFGLAAGDALLGAIAKRLKTCVRQGDLIARMEADSFAIILFPVQKTDIGVIMTIADRVQSALKNPFTIGEDLHVLSCCIGICLAARAPNSKADSLLKSADIALRRAQQDGAGSIRAFSPEMRQQARKIQHLHQNLHRALRNGEIRPYFQPQICTDTGKILGFEALARWHHPTDGIILPGLFLSAVAEAGKSGALGEVILHHSLSALKSWDRAGLEVPCVGVNYAAEELRNPKLVEKIKWAVEGVDLEAARLTIEVLENVVSDHDDGIITRNIRALASQGFAIDLDDFGTGHASISNIRRFAVSRIKIDRCFIQNIDQDKDQQIITNAILRMAESLGLKTLAEGVETLGEQSMLAQLGCQALQGFGIARPMPFEDTIAWMHAHARKLSKGPDFPRKTG